MPDRTRAAVRKRVLDPVERLSEILFGLIMVLTFTGSLSVATAERAEVREMLIGAIGCNIAWGLIDAIMYLMACMSERGATHQTVLAIRKAGSATEAHGAIREQLPPLIAAELRHEELERIRSSIHNLKLPTARSVLHADDFTGAAGVFLIVIASTFPVIAPFMFIDDAAIAIRFSNAVAIAMLAMIGYGYGKAAGLSPWWMSEPPWSFWASCWSPSPLRLAASRPGTEPAHAPGSFGSGCVADELDAAEGPLRACAVRHREADENGIRGIRREPADSIVPVDPDADVPVLRRVPVKIEDAGRAHLHVVADLCP